MRHSHTHVPAPMLLQMRVSVHAASCRAMSTARAHSHKAAVLLFFAVFASNRASTNLCPVGFLRLGTAYACESAAAVAGQEYRGIGAYSYYPTGCFWHIASGGFYYNTNTTGAANYYAHPMCAGAACPCARTKCRARSMGRAKHGFAAARARSHGFSEAGPRGLGSLFGCART
jgi:hypothetical protein